MNPPVVPTGAPVSPAAASDLTSRIGNTPVVRVRGLTIPDRVTVLGKAEWFNPGGSVKDRAAWSIVRAAEARGLLPGRELLDATSGNTGIAYAWIGAARGHAVTLCVPSNASPERVRLLRALGASLVLTDPLEGTDGARRVARAMAEAEPDRWFLADQYANPANPEAHEHGTATEIWQQTAGSITHFVAGIGTSGTLVGCSRRLRALDPGIAIVAVQPSSPYHALEGLKHLPSAERPEIYVPAAHDRVIEVDSESSLEMAVRQSRLGLPIGWSGGAALVAAERLAQELDAGVVVAILPDGAERYLSDPIWEELARGGGA